MESSSYSGFEITGLHCFNKFCSSNVKRIKIDYSNASHFHLAFDFVIFAYRQRIAKIEPAKITPKIGKVKVFLLFAIAQV